ncbi:ankyrin repeat protein [Trichoderma chlorosporum]
MAEHQHCDTDELHVGETVTIGETIAPAVDVAESGIVQEAPDNDARSESSDTASDITGSVLSTSLESEIIEDQSTGLHVPWRALPDADYDVITVHGIRDYYESTWKSDNGESWIRSRLFKDVSIRQLDFLYAKNDSARIFQREGIKAEAEDLMREYIEKRQFLSDMDINRPVVWICHDIGGSIVKQALIEASRATNREDYDDAETWERIRDGRRRIATCSTAIIFIGCPHKPRPLDVLEEEIHELMMLPGPVITSGLMKKIQIITAQVNETNIQFLETNFLSRIININVHHFILSGSGNQGNEEATSDSKAKATILEPGKLATETNDQHIASDKTLNTSTSITQPAVNPSSVTTESPGIPFGRYILTLGSTFELCCKYGQLEADHPSLVKDVGSSRGIWANIHTMLFTRRYYSLKINTELVHGQIALLSMMPPRKIHTAHVYFDVKGNQELPVLAWIAEQAAYRNFCENYGPQVLNIECTEGDRWRTSMLSQGLYDKHQRNLLKTLGQNQKGSFYFEFDKFDTRYNTIESMLIAFINEISCRLLHIPQVSQTIRRMFDRLKYYHCWSFKNLFKFFIDLRRCFSVHMITLILSGWENCVEEQRTWFLSRVLEEHHRSDLDYRLIIITNGPDKYLKGSIESSQVVSLSQCPMPIQEYAIDRKDPPEGLAIVLEGVLQKRPALKGIKELLSQMMDECQERPFLGYIILNWLAHFGRGLPISDIDIVVKQLRPITPEHILATIMEKHTSEKQNLARVIYQWVKYTMEPLTIEALGHAVAVSLPSDHPSSLDIDYEDLVENLERLFCGIIVLDGREVKFSHESFYSCPPVPQLGDDIGERPVSIHGAIAKACLNYLLREEILQNRYDKFSIENHGGDLDKCLLFRPRDDLLDYAVRLWATHYQLSDQCQPIDLALNFFQNKRARNKWAEAYYLLSNPFTRIHRSYISPLPMMSALGLKDVIIRQIEEDKASPWFQNDCWLAVTEAGRNGHIDVVRQLLNQVQVQELELQDAIYWSTFSDNKEIVAELLQKVTLRNSFSFPISLLSRASAAGLEELVSAILGQEDFNPSEPNQDIDNQTALHVAVYWNQKTIAELLLASGADAGAEDANGVTPLLLSIGTGCPEIVQLLLGKGKSVCDDQNLGSLLINAAITLGELPALKCVLLAGADCKTGEFEPSDHELPYPIINAAICGRIGCLDLLLENGADPCTESEEGNALYILSDNLQAIGVCRTLLEKGAPHHQCYPDKEMLLCRALRADNQQLIELLIEKGAKLDLVDTYKAAAQRTPLSFASVQSSIETLKLLLDKGADPNYRPEDASISSTLFLAAYNTAVVAKVELLLKRGADVHWKRSDGWTPLHAAYDMPALVSLLLDHGSDVNSMSADGTLLMIAARWSYPDTMNVLLSRKDPVVDLNAKFNWNEDESHSDYGKTALDLAIENGCYICANRLFEAGATIEVKFTHIKYTIRSEGDIDSEEEALRLLINCLQRGFKMDSTDESSKTALHHITKHTPTLLVEFLVEWGCQVDALDGDGLTPLATAVANGNTAAAEYLLRKGARADDDRPGSGSLLHLTLKGLSGSSEIIDMMKVLIAAGADPLQQSSDPLQESLLHAAIRYPRVPTSEKLRICRYLVLEAGLNVDTKSGLDEYPIILAANLREWKSVEYLIRRKADCSVTDSQGRRPLHYIASLYSDEKLFAVISESGTDLQAPDSFGRTPLHLAAGYGYRHSMRALISCLPEGFDVNVRDADGWTPLMWACKLDGSNWGVVEDLVTKHNADISVTSADGQWSPLKLAYFSDMEISTKKLLNPLAESEKDDLVLDASQHYEGPAVMDFGWRCNSCLLASRGQRYKCTTCTDSFDLCFKCYPNRSKMHDAGHSFEEYKASSSRDKTESDSSRSDSKAQRIVKLESDGTSDENLEGTDGNDGDEDDENDEEEEEDDDDEDDDDDEEESGGGGKKEDDDYDDDDDDHDH